MRSDLLKILFSAILLSAFAQSQDITQVVRQSGHAVVLIETFNRDHNSFSLGSGVVVKPSGVILTNFHVIDGAFDATVKFVSGEEFTVEGVIRLDENRDLATLKIPARDLPAVQMGNSDSVQVGEWAVAVGNPQGLEHTISAGIISAVRQGGFIPGKVLQTTAAISPGSSGGALLNMKGELIGIITFLIQGQNLNFAVAVNQATSLLGDSVTLTLAQLAEQRFLHGSEYLLITARCVLSEKSARDAIPYFEKVIEVDEENLEAHLELAMVLDSLSQVDKASEHYIEAIRIGPNSPKAHFGYGHLLMKSGNKKEALDEYQILKKLDRELAQKLFSVIYPDKAKSNSNK